MKKIILFLMLMVAFVATAQTVTLPSMASAAKNKDATGQVVTTDYTLTDATVRNFIWTAPQPKIATQDYVVKLDSLTGNHTNVAVALYGQKSSLKADWTQISTTVNWKGSTADTIIIISNATANRYSSYKTVFTGTGTGTTKIDQQGLKLYLE